MTQGTRQHTPPAYVGMSLPRQDGPDKVTGRTRYAGDQVVAGMLYARLVLSPYAHARILHIGTSAAQAMPGVVAVFTAATLGMAQGSPLSRVQSPLAQQEVLWCGHPVAVVVGETEALAEDGADAVEVDYEPLPAAIEPAAAARPGAPPARIDQAAEAAEEGPLAGFPQATAVAAEEGSSNVKQFRPMMLGNIEEGLRQAEVVVEGTYRTHPVHQSYLEPQSVTVAPSPSGHHLVVWSSTQGLFSVRSAVATALAMSEQQIRVEPVPIGGGFGGKESLLEPLAAAVATRLRRPIRLVYTRQDELLAGNPAPQMAITIKLGAKRDGTLTAIQVRMLLDAGAYPNPLAALSGFHFFGVYRCPNIAVRCDVVETNKPGTGPIALPPDHRPPSRWNRRCKTSASS